MSDRERIGFFLAGLVAVFVIAFFAGRVAGPTLGIDEPAPEHPAHAAGPGEEARHG